MRADIGIALDGDADRVLIVDERGHLVDGDQADGRYRAQLEGRVRLAKPAVVSTIMSNLGLERYLNGSASTCMRTPVGDRYVLEQMREMAINIGGEQSGHIIFSDSRRPATACSRRCRSSACQDRAAGR